jgi:hypothetical protein
MGLSLEVGLLADLSEHDPESSERFREKLSKLNRLLKHASLSPHVEPETCPVFSVDMIGYAGLHYVRRLAAHLELRGELPDPGDDDAGNDPILLKHYKHFESPRGSVFSRILGRKSPTRRFDHLINHSDAEGFYVPQDFADVLVAPPELEIAGGLVGSSYRLLEETRKIAEAIELPIETDPESDAVYEAIESQGAGEVTWQRYAMESYHCLQLHRAAEQSIEHGCVARVLLSRCGLSPNHRNRDRLRVLVYEPECMARYLR